MSIYVHTIIHVHCTIVVISLVRMTSVLPTFHNCATGNCGNCYHGNMGPSHLVSGHLLSCAIVFMLCN